MAKQIVRDTTLGGMPIEIDAESHEEAINIISNESPQQVRARVEEALRRRQGRTGISDNDIQALLNGSASYEDLPNAVQRVWLGFGKWSHETVQGARQRYAELTDDPESAALIGSDSAEMRELFQYAADAGFADDVGGFLGEMALFLGGGELKLGFQLLNLAARGAVVGYGRPTTPEESAEQNALFGAAFNSLVPGTRYAMSKLFRGRGGEATANLFGVLASASTGSGVGMSISAAHLFQTLRSSQAAIHTAMRAAREAGEQIPPRMVVANRLNQTLTTQLQRIIGRLHGADATDFLRTTTNVAFEAGMDPQTGVVNPQVIYHHLGKILPSMTGSMGALGDDLLRYRNAVGRIAALEGFDPKLVSNALNGLLRNPTESRGIAMQLYHASRPTLQEQLLNRLASLAPRQAAGAAFMQNVGQRVENVGGDAIRGALGAAGQVINAGTGLPHGQ